MQALDWATELNASQSHVVYLNVGGQPSVGPNAVAQRFSVFSRGTRQPHSGDA